MMQYLLFGLGNNFDGRVADLLWRISDSEQDEQPDSHTHNSRGKHACMALASGLSSFHKPVLAYAVDVHSATDLPWREISIVKFSAVQGYVTLCLRVSIGSSQDMTATLVQAS